jgi:hypothetical protein
MDYQINLITRSEVPPHIFLCGENDKPDFRYIHKFEFNNGLVYIIGSYYRIYSVDDIIENIESDFRTANEYNNNAEELQEYYKDEFDMHYKYSICLKIWNYYNNNKQLIKEVIDYYSNLQLDSEQDTNSDNESYDEGFESSDELVSF